MLFGVMIASHITSEKRIRYLLETLHSIMGQKMDPPSGLYPARLAIYLSVSFGSAALETVFENHVLKNYLVCRFREFNEFVCMMRQTKTAQMEHMRLLCAEIMASANVLTGVPPSVKIPLPDWVLFCDDDDLYSPTRVADFAARIAECVQALQGSDIPETRLAGLYESHDFGVDHRLQRHEYWCYCVRLNVIRDFFEKLAPYRDVIENKCCDIVWAEYLRRLDPSRLFSCVDKKMYYYRRHDNADSVTGEISNIQTRIIRRANPPAFHDAAFADYIVDWDQYLHENLDFYLHDTFLRTVVGNGFDDILRAEFLADYPYLEYVDACHVAKLRALYDRLHGICQKLYELTFPK